MSVKSFDLAYVASKPVAILNDVLGMCGLEKRVTKQVKYIDDNTVDFVIYLNGSEQTGKLDVVHSVTFTRAAEDRIDIKSHTFHEKLTDYKVAVTDSVNGSFYPSYLVGDVSAKQAFQAAVKDHFERDLLLSVVTELVNHKGQNVFDVLNPHIHEITEVISEAGYIWKFTNLSESADDEIVLDIFDRDLEYLGTVIFVRINGRAVMFMVDYSENVLRDLHEFDGAGRFKQFMSVIKAVHGK